jgi:glyoxylase-like metal-dependent hydrolase (beta-lactamase superfamily II)
MAVALVAGGTVRAQQAARPAAPATRPAAAKGSGDAQVHAYHVQGHVWIFHAGDVNAAVQIGDEGVLVVDTLGAQYADAMVAEIKRLAPNKVIRYIINTSADADHVGGNEKVSKAGESIVGGNFAGQVGQEAAKQSQIFAHENVQVRMGMPAPGEPTFAFAAWPTDTYIEGQKDLHFNGEAIELIHVDNAHSDGDSMVWFRGSDVLVTGDIYNEVSYPVVKLSAGGNLNGVIKGLNEILRITVPADKQEGGTYVIPGHGRYGDEADVFWYRNMVTVLRDRVQDAVKRGVSLDQMKKDHLFRDYDGRYGKGDGWTSDDFLDAAYKSLTAPGTTAAPHGSN